MLRCIAVYSVIETTVKSV